MADGDAILRELDSLRTEWSGAHTKWQKNDMFYRRVYPVWLPLTPDDDVPDRPSIRPGTSRSVVDHATDSQIGFIPSFHRDPAGLGDQHKADADQVEEGMKYVFQQAFLRNTVIPSRIASKYLTHLGYAILHGPILKDPYGLDARPKKARNESEAEFQARLKMHENRRRNWSPIDFEVPHPTQVYMDPKVKSPRSAILLKRSPLDDLLEYIDNHSISIPGTARQYLSEMEAHGYVDLIEHWTNDVHTVMLRYGEVLWERRNMWGIVPFTHAFSSWGMDYSYAFESGSITYAANMSDGLLEPLFDDIRAEAQVISSSHNLLMNAAWAPPVARDPEAMQEALAGDTVAEGRPDDFGAMDLIPKGIAPEIYRIYDLIRDDIDLAVPTKALSGNREAGVTTVGQQAIMAVSARRKYQSIAVALQHLFTIAAQKTLQMIDNTPSLDGGVGKPTARLTKKVIHNNYDINVAFEIHDPAIEQSRRLISLQEYDRGIIDKRTYLTEAGYENIEAIEKGLIIDQINRDPAVMRRFVMEVAAELGLEDVVGSVESQRERTESADVDPMAPDVGGLNGTGQRNGSVRGMTQPLTDDVMNPSRVNMGAF